MYVYAVPYNISRMFIQQKILYVCVFDGSRCVEGLKKTARAPYIQGTTNQNLITTVLIDIFDGYGPAG